MTDIFSQVLRKSLYPNNFRVIFWTLLKVLRLTPVVNLEGKRSGWHFLDEKQMLYQPYRT
jgi:hypothetical protein